MLKLDFYESGRGETIIVTFPQGGIGVVDASPSPTSSRPDILKIVQGKTIHFACLTHPHADHGTDLVHLVNGNCKLGAFWHTLSQVDQFFFGITQVKSFPNQYNELVLKMQEKWANFLIDLFYEVEDKKILVHQLRNDQQSLQCEGVDIHVLSPTETTQNNFTKANQKILSNPTANSPDPNQLSAILALQYGDAVVILGGDALRTNWDDAITAFRHRAKLSKAVVLKVPHHGAKNALRGQGKSYFDLCKYPSCKAVVIPGDSKHPHPESRQRLMHRTELYVVGEKSGAPPNPLRLSIPGAEGVTSAARKNPVVSMEIDSSGTVQVTQGCVET